MLSPDPSSPVPQWLLVSDIDDTLTGDDEALAELLARLAAAPEVALVLNSSRPRGSVERTLAGWPMPPRLAGMITAMGTEVALAGGASGWQDRFAGWDRAEVDVLMAELGARPHAEEFQTPFKASFAVEGAARREEVRGILREQVPGARVIMSGTSDVDILPSGAGKGEATLHVAKELGIDTATQLVVAGDSGNDLAMFEVSPRGILVGNARQELRVAVSADRAYQAGEPHAGGILEGLRHWGVTLPERPAPASCQTTENR